MFFILIVGGGWVIFPDLPGVRTEICAVLGGGVIQGNGGLCILVLAGCSCTNLKELDGHYTNDVIAFKMLQ